MTNKTIASIQNSMLTRQLRNATTANIAHQRAQRFQSVLSRFQCLITLTRG